ncbi:MAG: COG4315 family predicted lipoprotein [Hoeflea sp.]|uniref:COG4315 family predicted lipoprotein n=1 Tax=Hoeflea sp. TaxID=1940281 RepID=UPI003EF2479C
MKTLTLTTILLLATAASALAAPVKTVDTAKGAVLAGENGMTLYTFKKDTDGASNCNDACATNWPPLAAGADAKADGDYTMIERADGSRQWAKGGKALYFWIKDAKMGDTTGDGVKGVWDVARP